MTKRERVYATLRHQPTDKIVKGEICIYGGLANKILKADYPIDYIMSFGTPDEVKQNVKETIKIASKGSGFILSTCNTMVDIIPAENALAMVQAAQEYDKSNF